MLLAPWLVGLAGLGIGVATVGGNSSWLLAFTFVPLALCMIAIRQ